MSELRTGDGAEPVRGRIRLEYDNVATVKLWGFQGADPEDDHFHVQIHRDGGGSQSARISKEEFDRFEALLTEAGR